MKRVNLLPYWYERQQRQHRRLRTHVGVMVAIALAMVAATEMSTRYIAGLKHAANQLDAQLAMTHDPRPALQSQQQQLGQLENLQSAYRELGNTIPMSAVIQQIQNEMTIGMALSRVAIDVRPEPLKGSGVIGDPKHPIRNHDVARMTVVGIAPNDVAIAQLIGKVSSNPLFTDVALNYTRTELLNEHSIRRFEIQMQMDLDRLTTSDPESTPEKQTAMATEVIHAG